MVASVHENLEYSFCYNSEHSHKQAWQVVAIRILRAVGPQSHAEPRMTLLLHLFAESYIDSHQIS
jgi:hypothetical protein